MIAFDVTEIDICEMPIVFYEIALALKNIDLDARLIIRKCRVGLGLF